MFCITELGFSASCKFERLKNLVMYFFCYDGFRELPDEEMETFLREKDHYVCRQTIRGWLRRFEQNNLILQHSGDYIYYGIHNGERCEMSKEQYCAAWRSYFEDKEEGCPSNEAFMNMIHKFGCIPRKKEVALVNGLHTQTIDTLIDLAQKEIEKEIRSGEPE